MAVSHSSIGHVGAGVGEAGVGGTSIACSGGRGDGTFLVVAGLSCRLSGKGLISSSIRAIRSAVHKGGPDSKVGAGVAARSRLAAGDGCNLMKVSSASCTASGRCGGDGGGAVTVEGGGLVRFFLVDRFSSLDDLSLLMGLGLLDEPEPLGRLFSAS